MSAASSSASSVSGEQDSEARSPKKVKISRAKIACIPVSPDVNAHSCSRQLTICQCRSRRTKCGGTPPGACKHCVESQMPCSWPAEESRPKRGRPAKKQQSQDGQTPFAERRDSLSSLSSPLRDAHVNGYIRNSYPQHLPLDQQVPQISPTASNSRLDNVIPRFSYDAHALDVPASIVAQNSSRAALSADHTNGVADMSSMGHIFNNYSITSVQNGSGKPATQNHLQQLDAAQNSDARSHHRKRSESAVGWEHGLLVPPDANQPVIEAVGFIGEQLGSAGFAGPSTRRRRKGGWTALEEGTSMTDLQVLILTSRVRVPLDQWLFLHHCK